MHSISKALLVALTIFSTASGAFAESRFAGVFDARNMGVLLDTGLKVPGAKVTLPPGHLANADLTLPARTRERYQSSSNQLLSILPAARLRFQSKLETLRKNSEIVRYAKQIGPAYGVDPAAIVASILVELTFNNDWSMDLQKAAAFLPSQTFYPGAINLISRFNDSNLKMCHPERSDYWSWYCLNVMWDSSLRNVRANASSGASLLLRPGQVSISPTDEPLIAKLSPKILTLPAGLSFGPAQITLFRALMASDDVARVSKGRFPRVTIYDMPAVQRLIADVEPSVHIVAATLGRSVFAYRKFARIDISGNLGLQATLFNVGYEVNRALSLQNANVFAKPPNWQLPRENYFGYFANEHEKEIRALVNEIN